MLAPDLATTAAQVGERLAQRTRTVLMAVKTHRQRRWPPSPRTLNVGGAVALVLLAAGGFLLLRDSPAEAAFKAALDKELPAAERSEWADKARKLIPESEFPLGKREWMLGQLDEAQQLPKRALTHYRAAVKEGEPRAGARLIQLLKHEECPVRSGAADALGDLRLTSAREGLETLAKKGGAGDKSGFFGTGCDSSEAARQALGRLGR
jgi:hypothetical protein